VLPQRHLSVAPPPTTWRDRDLRRACHLAAKNDIKRIAFPAYQARLFCRFRGAGERGAKAGVSAETWLLRL